MAKEEKVLNEKMDINTPFKDFVRKFKKQKTAIVAMFFIIALVILAFISYQIAPYGINEYDYTAIMQGPSAAHWFGTDEFGRDLFSRIICGTRISLSVGLFSVSIAAVCGTILGLLGGYYGGILDSIIMRICDTLFAFPGIILAIAIIAILGSGMTNVVIAVAVFSTPTFARLVRSTTLSTKGNVFVQAARNLGASDARILFRHILPSAIPNHHRAVYHVYRNLHSDSIEPQLSGNGSPAADTGVGTSSEQRKNLHDDQLAHYPVSGPCHIPDGSVLQPSGGRTQGCTGSEADRLNEGRETMKGRAGQEGGTEWIQGRIFWK